MQLLELLWGHVLYADCVLLLLLGLRLDLDLGLGLGLRLRLDGRVNDLGLLLNWLNVWLNVWS